MEKPVAKQLARRPKVVLGYSHARVERERERGSINYYIT
jgi:hypothetical protein